MLDVTRKICLVGDFGVGKTSLVARFVNQIFSEKYQTTVGVKIDTKLIELAERRIKLVIWDLAGKNTLDATRLNYLKGAAGLLLVADGTRESTLRTALYLWMQARQAASDPQNLPAVLLINKHDIVGQWEVTPEAIEHARQSLPVLLSSAKSGDGVEQGFLQLGHALP